MNNDGLKEEGKCLTLFTKRTILYHWKIEKLKSKHREVIIDDIL
jgi:hypothetical protein